MEELQSNCLICGREAYGFLLCKDCYYQYKDQRILVAIDVDPNMNTQLVEEPIAEDSNDNSKKCLICGHKSGQYLFCKSCFPKYMNKTLWMKITVNQNQKLNILDERYEGIYECEDGHLVKSTIEQTIDNWLFNNNIKHGYEVALDVGMEKPLHPDFVIKDFFGKDRDLYIEYFGQQGQPEYDKMTQYKMELYKKNKTSILCLYPKDSKNIIFTLKRKLNSKELKENEINYKE